MVINSLFIRVKEESEKGNTNSTLKKKKKTKIIAFGLIIALQIEGGKVEALTDFIFLGSRITADGDCRHEIKRCLILGRKAMTNLHSTITSRNIILPTKVCTVKAIVFPVVMYRFESFDELIILNCGSVEDS